MWPEELQIMPNVGDAVHVRHGPRFIVANRIRSVVRSQHDHDGIICRKPDGQLGIYNERRPHSVIDPAREYLENIQRKGGDWVITRPAWVLDQEMAGIKHVADLEEWRDWINIACRLREGNHYPMRNIWIVYKRNRRWARWIPGRGPNEKAFFCSAAVRQIYLDNRIKAWVPDAVKDEPLAASIHWARAIRDMQMVMLSHTGDLGERIVRVK